MSRLARERAGTAAREAEELIAEVLGGFELGDREPRSGESYAALRARLDAEIVGLR
jgi:hypothetical protein